MSEAETVVVWPRKKRMPGIVVLVRTVGRGGVAKRSR